MKRLKNVRAVNLHGFWCFCFLFFFTTTIFAQTAYRAIYDGGNTYDVAAAVTAARNGNLLVVGLTNRAQTGREVFVMRIDKKGEVIWVKNFPISPQGVPSGILETKGGDIFVLGSNGVSRSDIFAIRLTATGSFLWSKSYGTPITTPLLIGKSMIQTQDAGFVITGSYQSGSGLNRLVLFKMNDKGEHLWSKEYGVEDVDSYGNIVRELPEGDLVVAGESMRADSSTFAFLMRTNAMGDRKWFQAYTAAESLAGLGLQVKAGNLVLSGQIGHEAFLAEADPEGNLVWARKYELPGEQEDCTLGFTQEGNFLIQGRTLGEESGFFLLLVNEIGFPTWSKVFPGDHFTLPANYITGHSNATPVQLKEGGYGIAGGIFSAGDPANILILRTDKAGFAPCRQLSPIPNAVNLSLENQNLEPTENTLPLLPNAYVPSALFYHYTFVGDGR